ncbi:MAG: hypothetical protein IPN34_13720 [Planctomycetes bacterium]|nr:hypothetical protein [Planctomycetota bacterium]
MSDRWERCVGISFVLATVALCSASSLVLQDPVLAPKVEGCDVDLSKPGEMRDVLSNALTLGLQLSGDEVRVFLEGERKRAGDGGALLQAAARHFAKDRAELSAAVERYRHCNCKHPLLPGQVPLPPAIPDELAPPPATTDLIVTPFAKDVLLHVVLHELGHALVREFDLPVLANEEALADAFATHYLLHQLPERAEAVLRARVASLMTEAREVPRAAWPVDGEHENDARRAFCIAALAVAVDAQRYAKVAELAGLSEEAVREAQDYGAEVHRSWRRTLRPLWMPAGELSREARVLVSEEDPFLAQLAALGLAKELEDALRRFDWHSTVKIRFEAGEGTASWSRSSRAITVTSGYVLRFVEQGQLAGF